MYHHNEFWINATDSEGPPPSSVKFGVPTLTHNVDNDATAFPTASVTASATAPTAPPAASFANPPSPFRIGSAKENANGNIYAPIQRT